MPNNYQSTHIREQLFALKEGSQLAFEEIYTIFSARIYANILKMVKSTENAKELHQEVFVKVWDKRHLIDPDQSFTSYLFQISKNTVYNYIRRNSLDIQVQHYLSFHQIEAYKHVEEQLEYSENEKFLNESISLLPPKRKIVFELCKIEGKSYEEVSSLLGISTSTINDHIVKATKFIKDRQMLMNGDYLLILAIGIMLQELN